MLFPLRGLSLVRTTHLRWHLLRALMFIAMTGINFWALQYLQLTVTASIFFSVPIIIALVSATVFREKLDTGRWVAIVAGFAGVLVIVHPGSAEFHPAMLLVRGQRGAVRVFHDDDAPPGGLRLAGDDPVPPGIGRGDRARAIRPGGLGSAERMAGMDAWPACSACSAASATTCSRSRTAMLPPA